MRIILDVKLVVLLLFLSVGMVARAQVCNYADSVISYSSEWSTGSWNHQQVLGPFNTYPCYGDIGTAWASATSSGHLEFLELYFDNNTPIDSIYIFQTYHTGAIDSVFVKNPTTLAWDVVYTAIPSAVFTSEILKIGFPMTSYPVQGVRITINSILVPGWNEIDAVAISSPFVDVRDTVTLTCYSPIATLSGTCGNNSIGNTTFHWTTSNGNIVSGNNTFQAVVDAAGDYQLEINKDGVVTRFIVPVVDDQIVPLLDDIADVDECDSFVLPVITGQNLSGNQQYYTSPGGNGTSYTAGTNLVASDFATGSITLYVYDMSGLGCAAETSFTLNLHSTPQLSVISDTVVCGSYMLPDLLEGVYYSQPNAGGGGLAIGEYLQESQQVYVYAADGVCSAEASFHVDVLPIPMLDALTDTIVCDALMLPEITGDHLTGGQKYYTQAHGGGDSYDAGDWITTNDFSTFPVTLYIFDSLSENDCYSEKAWQVTILETPTIAVMSDTTVCNSFTLPAISVGHYYSQPHGAGIQWSPGDVLMSNQSVYIYATNGVCDQESSFQLTIESPPVAVMMEDVTECGAYVLPELLNGNYYLLPDGEGEMLAVGQAIENTNQVYIYVASTHCSAESSFHVQILPLPTLTAIDDTISYDSYVLPSIANGEYHTGQMGSGITLLPGDVITTSQTIYVYAENDDCFNETSFDVTITYAPGVPDCTTITTPVDGSSNIAVPTTIHWQEAYGAEGYNVFIGTTPGASDVLDGLDVGHVVSYTPSVLWGENTEYYLRVIAYNDYGEALDCEEISFTTQEIWMEHEAIPTFFTPNGDGFNDYWQIANPNHDQEKFRIYDRYGKLLAELSTLSLGWDGSFHGQPMASDDYWYVIEAYNGKLTKGHFSLIRK